MRLFKRSFWFNKTRYARGHSYPLSKEVETAAEEAGVLMPKEQKEVKVTEPHVSKKNA